jgi:hypothetical protein
MKLRGGRKVIEVLLPARASSERQRGNSTTGLVGCNMAPKRRGKRKPARWLGIIERALAWSKTRRLVQERRIRILAPDSGARKWGTSRICDPRNRNECSFGGLVNRVGPPPAHGSSNLDGPGALYPRRWGRLLAHCHFRFGSAIASIGCGFPLLSSVDNRPSMFLTTSTSSCRAYAASGDSSARSRIDCIARSARFSWLLGMPIRFQQVLWPADA